MRPVRFLTLALLLFAACWPAGATMLVSMDLPDLVSSAATIAHGRVTDTRAAVINGRTETVITLAAEVYLKGAGAAHVAFRVPGGQIGRYRTVVVGAPMLQEGDEIVAFLADRGTGLPIVVGFSQGVLRVVRQGFDAPMVLAPPTLRDAGRAARVVRGELPRRFVSLPAFIQDVRGLAAAQAADASIVLRPGVTGAGQGSR